MEQATADSFGLDSIETTVHSQMTSGEQVLNKGLRFTLISCLDVDHDLPYLLLGLLYSCLKACFDSEGVLVIQKLEVVASNIRFFHFR